MASPSRRRRRTSRPGTSPGASRRSRGSSSAQCSVQWQWDRSGGRNHVEVGSAEGGLSALPLLSVVSRAASGVVGSSGVVGRALEGQRAAFVPF